MSTLFVVSPCYLESIYHESKKYDFDLQGYGSFNMALNGLIKVNCSDILGFAFAGIHLPGSRTKEFKSMLQFFDSIELMHANKKFVIATDESVAPWSKIFKRYHDIRFVKVPSYDFMSDIIVNKQIFGSILLDNADPYVFERKANHQIDFDAPRLEYVPLFSDAQIQCVSKVDILDTLERTLDNDAVFRRFKGEKADLQYFRMYYIALLMQNKNAILDARNHIDEILDACQEDTSSWCALLAVKNYMEGNIDE